MSGPRPRRRILGAVLVVVALAACGGGDDATDELGPVASPETSDTVKWAVDVCTSITDWLRDLDGRAVPLTAQLDAAAPGQAKQALVAFFDDTVPKTEALLAEIEDLGDPPIEGGDEAAARLREGLAPVLPHFERARDSAAALPATGDTAAARAPLVAAIHDGAKLARVAYAALENGEPRRLGALAAQELECDFVYDDGPNGPEPAPGFSV